MCVNNEFLCPPCQTRWVPDQFHFIFDGRKDESMVRNNMSGTHRQRVVSLGFQPRSSATDTRLVPQLQTLGLYLTVGLS